MSAHLAARLGAAADGAVVLSLILLVTSGLVAMLTALVFALVAGGLSWQISERTAS